MRLLLPPLVLLALAGCSKPGDASAALLTEVKRRLSERDARLASYRLEGQTREGEAAPVAYAFAYRAPQRLRAWLGAPLLRTFSWDGERLFEQSDADRRFTTFKTELSPERQAGFLTEVFAPLTPEGLRAPLLPGGLSVKRVSHARAPEAVELAAKGSEPASQGLRVTYTLRWPSLDFLARSSQLADGTTLEVRMEEESCDEALQLCVPKRLTRWAGGQQVGETTLSRIELNPVLPNDTFILVAPEGYDVQTRTLVNSEVK
ncbi:hypothetical protein POL68_31300 [Stigmatella sp. ncwal1]|uniref:Lipoprotein n=1 Tax=Stigmatella ashevillensis TaxID=2995309 RepID=A0ABT5DH53_9BACT|nr:hypothetical protein [Stigmatella ashevillena]MDC0712990.1 hypothetical protein [Stigmatella ashevillena]